MLDNTAKKAPITKIKVDTPYLKEVETMCFESAIYDIISSVRKIF